MRENLYITFVAPEELARALRVAAAVRGMNRSEFIRGALREKLAERPIEVKIAEPVRDPANA